MKKRAMVSLTKALVMTASGILVAFFLMSALMGLKPATLKVGDIVWATGDMVYNEDINHDRCGVMILNVAFDKVMRDGEMVVIQENVGDCRLFLKKDCYTNLPTSAGMTVSFTGEVTEISRGEESVFIKIEVLDCPKV